jgi:hypothetical protein
MKSLRHGSVIAQLANDQLLETQGDELDQAFRRGHNHGIRHAIAVIRIDQAMHELATAPVIRTVELEHEGIDLKLKNALVRGDS